MSTERRPRFAIAATAVFFLLLYGYALVFIVGGATAIMNETLAYSMRRMSVSRAFAYSYLVIYALSTLPGMLLMGIAPLSAWGIASYKTLGRAIWKPSVAALVLALDREQTLGSRLIRAGSLERPARSTLAPDLTDRSSGVWPQFWSWRCGGVDGLRCGVDAVR